MLIGLAARTMAPFISFADEGPPLRACLFGAALDTSNLGVSALACSIIGGLARLNRPVSVTLFDHGRGLRPARRVVDGRDFAFDLCGLSATRRFYRTESMWNARVRAWLGGLGSEPARRIREADVVFDISGGDSFSDLYGQRRFNAVAMCKRMALEQRRPLVLLPQTYGPYRDGRNRRVASDIVRRAAQCWARDPRSFEILRDLLGGDFDPARHFSGVDVAFALPEAEPPRPLPAPLEDWFADREESPASNAGGSIPFPPSHPPTFPPLLGFNVSGLIYNDPVDMRERYGFKADYRELVHAFLRRVLDESDARVLLVPHVLAPEWAVESDPRACRAVYGYLRESGCDMRRVAVAPRLDDPSQMKWLIARCDWFCGTRMHACIAGLSSGVPTVGIAYSDKARGVFETCGADALLLDPRTLDAHEALRCLLEILVAAPVAALDSSSLVERATEPLALALGEPHTDRAPVGVA